MRLIIITGPSGSGKTTLSREILKEIKHGFVLSTDNYYKTGIFSRLLSKCVKNYFDKKISFNYKLLKKDFDFIIKNGECNYKYIYDFKNKTIKKSFIKTLKIKFLIIEGIFSKEILKHFNKRNIILIEIKISKETCMRRAIIRDINNRGKSKRLAKQDFLNSWDIFYHTNKNNNSKISNYKFLVSKKQDINNLIKKIKNLKI